MSVAVAALGLGLWRVRRSPDSCRLDQPDQLLQSFLMLLSMLVLTCVLYAVPWTTSKFADVTAYGVIGGTVAILLIRKSALL